MSCDTDLFLPLNLNWNSGFSGLQVGQLLDWSLPHWLCWFSGLPTGNWTALLALLDFWLAHGRSWNFCVFHNHLTQFLINSCLYFSLYINPVCSVSLTNTDTIFKRFSFADRFPFFFFFFFKHGRIPGNSSEMGEWLPILVSSH